MADDSKDRAVDSVEAYEPEIKVINPTLTYVKVGGRILKLREMNNKKVKLLLEMIAEVMEEVFGGKISINIKTAEDFMKFINEVPERKINEFIKFVFATKDDPEPVNDEFISEYFTPRLVQALFKEVLRQNDLTSLLNFIKGQLPKLIDIGRKATT